MATVDSAYGATYGWVTRLNYETATSNADVSGNFELGIYALSGKDGFSGKFDYTLYVNSKSAGTASKTVNAGSFASVTTLNGQVFPRLHYDYRKYVYATINGSSYNNVFSHEWGSQTASVYIDVPAKPSYTVSYNGNGHSVTIPSSQTKWYGEALTLSSLRPTDTNYEFKGWATSATGSVVYQPGATYTGNSAVTLYAIWEFHKPAPNITNASAIRCNSSGTAQDDGTYAKVTFDWSTYSSSYPATAVKATCNGTTASGTAGSSSGSFSYIFSGLSAEESYNVTLTVSDSDSTTTTSVTVPSQKYLLDFSPNFGIGLGGAATRDQAITAYYDIYASSGEVYRTYPYTEKVIKAYWQTVYPVGAVYLSYNSTSPASLFGGSWTQISGYFLRAASDTGIGGANTVSHAHETPGAIDDAGTYYYQDYRGSGVGSGVYASQAYVHQLNASSASTATMRRDKTFATSVNNMPLYQDLYAWRRTA